MKLRPYQEEDVNFLSSLRRAACFNEQRTGKTPTILRVLVKRKLRKALIVCPASAVYPWKDAFELWTDKPCVVINGTLKKKRIALSEWTYGAVISYDTLKLIERKAHVTGMIHEVLACSPDVVVADEAHRIRNPRTATARAIFLTMKVPARYALTGTPVLNKPHEIYSILHWLFPQLYNSEWGFYHTFFHVLQEATADREYQRIAGFKPLMKEAMQEILVKLSTQRKRKEVMPWLPAKDYQPIRLPCTEEQERHLKNLEETFETEHVVTQGILDRLIRVRQICLSPELLDLGESSPKIEWILEYLEDYPGTPTIIFSKFTGFLKLLRRKIIKDVGVIFGETPNNQRAQYVNAFQAGKLKLLLINIDAGKEALTLDRAEAIIFTDKFPPVGDIQQAEDRFVSTTQDKADKPHVIYELMMKGTYEEQMYKMLRASAGEIDIINDYKKYLKGRYTHE